MISVCVGALALSSNPPKSLKAVKSTIGLVGAFVKEGSKHLRENAVNVWGIVIS